MSDLFTPLRPFNQALAYHLERHAVLASNVANAETPGYRPFDLALDASRAPEETMARTAPGHLTGTGGGSVSLFEAPSADPGPNGNAVDVDREMAKLAANAVRYRAVVEMLNRRLAVLRYAIHEGPR